MSESTNNAQATLDAPAPRGSANRRKPPPGMTLVDVEVLGLAKYAAKLRLNKLRDYERQTDGVPRTSLSDIARAALMQWTEPEEGTPAPETPRRKNRELKPFRFYMPEEIYDARKEAIRRSGGSVARVVQDALERFAKTGKI